MAAESHSTNVTPSAAAKDATTLAVKQAARLVPRETPFWMPSLKSSRTVTIPITKENTVRAIEKFDTTRSFISDTMIIMP